MESERPKAVIVGVRFPDDDDRAFEASLVELERLVTTLGYRAVGRITQARLSLAPAAVLGEGKLAELAELTGGTGHTGTTPPRKRHKAGARWDAEQEPSDDEDDEEDEQGEDDENEDSAGTPPKIELVAVDHDLSPSQARNLERATGTTVLDRSGVIIEIFHRHARSREARLEVEIARLAYQAPRLREAPSGKERQHLRGSGDSALELDRRRIRDRIAELRDELASIRRERDVRRVQRKDARRVALVGYTNAGKSSLMRALTGSSVEVKDKLFATLDTTVRALSPEVKPRILVSDTVGFIKKLPHDLVASFQSTLDEALEASLLLCVVDASDPSFEEQLAVTRGVLGEIGAAEVPFRLVMNKMDRLSDEARSGLVAKFPDAWFISTRSEADVTRVWDNVVDFFESAYSEAEFVIPYARQALVSEFHESGRVVETNYDDEGVRLKFRADADTLDRLAKKLR
ncbi:MAG TPA: GTPase HflX [Polyangiaceae bacterium]|nr:GTPase HflX [Polyangiaceae bacterium]